MISKGHDIIFTVREGECQAELLSEYCLNFRIIGRKQKGKYRKFFWILVFSFRIARIAIRFKPDLFLSHGSMYAGYAAFLTGKRHIALEDTGNMEQIFFSKPVSDVILSPRALQVDLGKKHLRYDGFHELAYLHPIRFAPDNTVLGELDIKEGEQFTILRFISWKASHDQGHSGLTREQKFSIIGQVSKFGKVFISSEEALPEEFDPFTLKIAPHRLHHLLYYASVYIGEGATTASECAMLGTPAIYVNTNSAGTLNAQERYRLLYCISDFNELTAKVQELFQMTGLKDEFRKRRDAMLKDNIDVTAFLVWFVENYPSSQTRMKSDVSFTKLFR